MVDRVVNKLIKGKIIEILVVLGLVFISIPVWHNFDKKISNAKVVDIDQYNLDFMIEHNDNGERLIVKNQYNLNKSFRILLRINKNVDINKSKILINDKTYKLTEFKQENKAGYYYFTIALDYIIQDIITYDVEPLLDGNVVNYAYIFEENINF